MTHSHHFYSMVQFYLYGGHGEAISTVYLMQTKRNQLGKSGLQWDHKEFCSFSTYKTIFWRTQTRYGMDGFTFIFLFLYLYFLCTHINFTNHVWITCCEVMGQTCLKHIQISPKTSLYARHLSNEVLRIQIQKDVLCIIQLLLQLAIT